jgi:hypothetical protein
MVAVVLASKWSVQARDGLQVQGGGIGGLQAAQPVAIGAQVLGQLEAVTGVGGGRGRSPAGRAALKLLGWIGTTGCPAAPR